MKKSLIRPRSCFNFNYDTNSVTSYCGLTDVKFSNSDYIFRAYKPGILIKRCEFDNAKMTIHLPANHIKCKLCIVDNLIDNSIIKIIRSCDDQIESTLRQGNIIIDMPVGNDSIIVTTKRKN